MAQPPLSQQIRQLERELGVELFARNTRKVALTPAGQTYIQRVISILDSIDVAGQHAQRVAAGAEGHLVIGCVGSATYSLLPQTVRALRKELPNVDVSVRGEMLAPAQVAALLAGEIDIGLLRPPIQHPDIQTMPLRRDRLIVALPADHRLARRNKLHVADLRNEDFITHTGQGLSVMGGVIAAVCADAGFVPRIRHQVQETSTLVTLVAAGLGVAIVPAPTSALDIAGVRHVALSPATLGVDLLAAWRSDVASAAVQRILPVLRHLTGVTDSRGRRPITAQNP